MLLEPDGHSARQRSVLFRVRELQVEHRIGVTRRLSCGFEVLLPAFALNLVLLAPVLDTVALLAITPGIEDRHASRSDVGRVPGDEGQTVMERGRRELSIEGG